MKSQKISSLHKSGGNFNIFFTFAFFSSLIILQITQVHAAPAADQDQTNQDPQNQDGTLWTPPNGDRDAWLRCHGQEPEVCRNQSQKIELIRNLISKRHGIPTLAFDAPAGGSPGSPGLNIMGGCILLTDVQLDRILSQLQKDPRSADTPQGSESTNGDSSRRKRKRRGGVTNMEKYTAEKWSMPIHYKFDGSHNPSQQQLIRNAFQHWMDNTCVRFSELSSTTIVPTNHILVTNDNTYEDKCYSYVGKASIIPQQLNLAPTCLTQFGTPVHEIGHALGLWHEQVRPDRDSNIRVLWNNIVPTYISQFYTNSDIDTRGQKYDYSSVMHYASLGAVSWNGQNTMISTDPLYQMNMGQRTGLSYADAKIINMVYCQNTCKRSLSRPCARGGYQNPNNCDVCICPDGFSGQFCEQVAPPKNAQCGGSKLLGLREDYIIKSPGYDIPQYYNSYQECSWLITAPPGQRLRLDFQGSFGVYYQDNACIHWVEVKFKTDLEYQGARFCGYQLPTTTLWSETNEMVVIFRSNFSGQYSTAQRGFQARITIESNGLVLPTIDGANVDTTTTTTTSTSTTKTTTTTTTTKPTTTTTRPGASDTDRSCTSLDVAFLVDTSNYIELSSQRRVTSFINNVVTSIQRAGIDLRAGLGRFTTYPTKVVGINDQFVSEGLYIVEPLAWRLVQHDTDTSTGLNMIRTQILGDARYSSGGNGYVPRVCVLITNGGSTINKAAVLAEADAARRAGIRFIVIGVGPYVNGTEAAAITGSDSDVLYARDYSDFDQTSNTPDMISITRDAICDSTKNSQTPQPLWDCEFEPGQGQGQICGMIQDKTDQFDWTPWTGHTPSELTGPPGAYSGSYFIYIEASDRQPNDEARIFLPKITSYSGPGCLEFYYNMYGFHINTLKLVEIRPQYSRVLFLRYKEIGPYWNKARVDVTVQQDIQLQFVGSRGQEYSGDIALDQMSLKSGVC